MARGGPMQATGRRTIIAWQKKAADLAAGGSSDCHPRAFCRALQFKLH